MSRIIKKKAYNVIDSESEEEENSTIESSFDESNAANVSEEKSIRPNDDIEIPETDDEIEQSGYVEENSNQEEIEQSREAGSSFIDESADESHKNVSNQHEDSSVNQEHGSVDEISEGHIETSSRNNSDDSQSEYVNESNAAQGTSKNSNLVDGNDSDSDEEIVVIPRHIHAKNRIADSSDDEEEEEKVQQVVQRRQTFYLQHPDGDDDAVEDQAYSKATRRSIFGAPSVKAEAVSHDEVRTDESDSDSDVIILSEDEENDKENFGRHQNSQLSSTLRSPLKDSNNSISSPEISNGNINVKDEPLDASDKKPIRVPRYVYDDEIRKRDSLLQRIRMAENNTLLSTLPDKGAKLLAMAAELKKELKEKNEKIEKMIIDEEESISNRIKRSVGNDSTYNPSDEDPSFKDEEESMQGAVAAHPTNFLKAEDVLPKYTGKVGMKNFMEQKAMTVQALEDINEQQDERPEEDTITEPPKYLKIELMKHQLHAIAFMQWRERQKTRGGLLADDMGLGKTLTAIALVLKQLQIAEEADSDAEESEDEGESEWIAQGRRDLKPGGTLIICPASLMNQWDHEIKTKIKRGALDVCVFHGAKRPTRARELKRYDVVITTYQIVVSEHKNDGVLFDLRWDRIILDEGHVIRNHRSKQNEAVCALEGKKRWVLTGTPVHNKEFDMYAVIKFLRCRPFDDLMYWRQWIENKKGNSPRLQILLKSILLRRTKTQLMESGEVKSLPNKIFEEVKVTLNPEERKVYMKIAAYSKAVFARFLQQQQDKHNNFTYDQMQLQRLHSKLQRAYRVDEVKASQILVLLLRMRQVCCHPGLIKKALDDIGIENESMDGVNESVHESDGDLIKKLQDLQINENGIGAVDEAVYDMNVPSSKLDKLVDILREKLEDTDDKIIIVSQWVSFLDIIRGMLEIEGIEYCELTGRIPVKKRNDIVVEFNRQASKARVMLLSITAGGVGLNLVGANILFILDPHWNPQIEQQAQDRVYRFGQTKNVKIVKFVTEDTIEEDIVKVQKNKLELATSTLTGVKSNATKLTLDDLKSLFGFDKDDNIQKNKF